MSEHSVAGCSVSERALAGATVPGRTVAQRSVCGAVVVALLAIVLAACGSGTSVRPTGGAVASASSSASGSSVTSAPAVAAAAPASPVTRPATTSPAPAPNPCAGNTAKQLVRVRLSVQHLWMCARTTLVYSTPITSGMIGQYTETPTGSFTVQGRVRNTTLTLLSGKTYDVKYWIPFQGPLFGFHDSSWQDFAYGSPKYRTDGSHGCVHMPLTAIAFLYKWAHVGAKVKITKK